MKCPKCGSDNCHLVESTEMNQSYSFGKGCCGFLLFGNILGALCGIGGKKKREEITYWRCEQCGAKFQRGMTDDEYEIKQAIAEVPSKLRFVELDDSSPYLYRVRTAVETLKPIPELWNSLSIAGHISVPESTATILGIVFRKNIPDIVCCLAVKQGIGLGTIGAAFEYYANGASTLKESFDEFFEPDFSSDFSSYAGLIILETGFVYFDGHEVFQRQHEDINQILVLKNDIKIKGCGEQQEISLIGLISKGKIKAEKVRSIGRFLQRVLMEHNAFSHTAFEHMGEAIGINNTLVQLHSGNMYVSIQNEAILKEQGTMFEINDKGEYFQFCVPGNGWVYQMDLDDQFLYFLNKEKLSRIRWKDLENRVDGYENVIDQAQAVDSFQVIDEWVYYITKKQLIRKSLNTGEIEPIVLDAKCDKHILKSGEALYFINQTDNKTIYSLNCKSKQIKKVPGIEKVDSFSIYKNNVFFYQGFMGMELQMLNITTGKKQTIDSNALGMNLANGYLYYTKGGKITEYCIETGNYRKVCDITARGHLEIAGKLVCCTVNDDFTLNYVVCLSDGLGQVL